MESESSPIAHTKHGDLTLDQIAETLPGMSHLMVEVSDRYWILYYAAKAGKWDLARHEFSELRKTMRLAALVRPKYQEPLDQFDAEYMKPLVLLVGGVAVTMMAMMGFGATAGAGSAFGALVHLVIGSATGAAIFWLAAKTWLDDLGPAQLILLRVAGINAAVVAVFSLMVAVGMPRGVSLWPSSDWVGDLAFGCFGLLIISACWIGLTMWLFDLSFVQVVLLIIFVFIVNFVIGYVLRATGLTM